MFFKLSRFLRHADQRLFLGTCTTFALLTSVAQAKVFLTQEEALNLAFPKKDCKTTREAKYLTDPQLQKAKKLAQVPLESALVTRYVGLCKKGPAGVAYFDTHRVRTLSETLMILISPEGSVKRIEMLSFQEPQDYIPGSGWYELYQGKKIDAELFLKKSIPSVSGATLTAKATLEAVRRVLAYHKSLQVKDK